MKKIFLFILALAASAGTVFAGTVASGTCGSDGDNLTWTLDDQGKLTISGSGAMADWNGEYPSWESYSSSIVDVEIGFSVTNIGMYAFKDYTNLKKVSMGNAVATIGAYAFKGCTSLKDLVFGNSYSILTEIGNSAFMDCSSLTSVYLPNSLKKIKEAAFRGCGLKAIVIPNGVTEIGQQAFYNCSAMTTLIIGSGVTSIKNSAFKNCSALTSITCLAAAPPTCGNTCFDGVTKTIPVYVPKGKVAAYTDESAIGWKDFDNIKDEAFASGTCGASGDNLTWKLDANGVLTISGTGEMANWTSYSPAPWYEYKQSIKSVVFNSGVTSIGEYALYECADLISIEMPNSVTKINSEAFGFCYALTSVEIPEGVVSIGSCAFVSCTALAELTIPSSVTEIKGLAFYNNTALTSITCYATTPPTCVNDCFGKVDKSIPVYVPYGTATAYQDPGANWWNDFTNIQEMKCLLASGTCGKNGNNLTWELDCDGVLTISGTGEMKDWMWSFETPWADYLSSIKSLVINDGVTSLGNSAFEDCTGLTSVTIPAGITNIRTWAFNKCSGLTSFEVAKDNPNYCAVDGVLFNKDQTMLVQYPIGNTRTEYTIPNGVTTIRQCAFGYSVLTSVTIPSSVTDVDPNAFFNCSGLTSITCEATTPPACGEGCFYNVDKTIPLYVPKGKVEAYKDPSANGWKDFNNIQEIGGATAIDEIVNRNSSNRKLIRDGQLLILRDGKTFTVTGQEVK